MWKEKIKRLKKTLKGWNINEEGKIKKMAMELRKKINILDTKTERLDLSEKEKDEKMNQELQLRNILLEQEIKMKQRARERCIIEGDENTKYFDLK